MIELEIDRQKLPYLDAQEVKYSVIERQTAIPALVIISLEGSSKNVMRFGHAMMYFGRENAFVRFEVDQITPTVTRA